MISKLVLANVHQFVNLAKQKPQLLNIGQLGSLRPAVEHKGCNCKSDINWSDYREKFEICLQLLTTEDMDKLKMVLQAKEICYNYKKPGGGIGTLCF